jgi:hypothetical protein
MRLSLQTNLKLSTVVVACKWLQNNWAHIWPFKRAASVTSSDDVGPKLLEIASFLVMFPRNLTIPSNL